MKINIPMDYKLEGYILSAVMNTINAADEVNSQLTEDDFYNPMNKIVFQAFRACYDRGLGVTPPSMLYAATKQKNSDFDPSYIQSVANEYWSGMPWSKFIADLKNITCLRRALFAGQELIAESSKDGAQIDEVISEHQTKLLQAQGVSAQKSRSLKDIITNVKDGRSLYEEAMWRKDRHSKGLPTYEGLSTGYPLLDDTLGCLQKSAIYYVGARTSMGKTTFMLNLIQNMMDKYKIGIFSLEMPGRIITEKLCCIKSDIRYSEYVKGNISQEQCERLLSLEPFLSNVPVYIEDEDALNINKLTARAKRLKQNHGIEILFVDYLTRVQSATKYPSKHLQVDEVSKGLQSLAKTLDIPIVCLAQLNRQVTNREKNRPSLSDFRESGSIEEDADGCILLHRPEYYDPNDKPGVIEVIVAKNRIMGELKTIQFSCNRHASERYHESKNIQDYVKEKIESVNEESGFNKLFNNHADS